MGKYVVSIGGIIQPDNKDISIVCVENTVPDSIGCIQCCLRKTVLCTLFECYREKRNDGKSVHFEKINKTRRKQASDTPPPSMEGGVREPGK